MSLFASLTDAAYALVRPIVHATDGEAAHNLTLNALAPLPRARHALSSPMPACRFAGLPFPNPAGVAPGFAKYARLDPGRASCRERGRQVRESPVVAGPLKTTN